MKKKSDNHAFLILTDCVSESSIRLYLQVKAATIHLGETFIVYHNKTDKPEQRLQEYNTYEFTNTVLHELGYAPVRDTLVPGSNHFPILKFYLDNPGYDYYWCIEDDIVFNGIWLSFFNQVIKNVNYDFISSYVKYKRDNINPDWPWWNSLTKTDTTIDHDDLAMSFNPIYSLSNKAACFLDQSLKAGWKGHHEVLMATLLVLNKFKVKDFGGNLKFVPKGFKDKFYTDDTHLFRPSFEAAGDLLNKIYHPVKNRFKITAGFKYKISFCIISNNLGRLKQYLIENIKNTLTYENFEFVILDCNSRDTAESWLRENIIDHINSGKVVYYKTDRERSLNHNHTKNIAFKLASGDIICSIDDDQLIGEDFAPYINDQFKTNSNIVIAPINFIWNDELTSTTGVGNIAVKKDDFLYVKGFNERIKAPGLGITDFINRLELSRTKRIIQKGINSVPHWPTEKFSLENAYITLDKILVQYSTPFVSNLIFMYHNGVFEMGTIINNTTKGSDCFGYSYIKRRPKSEYTLKGSRWITGNWHLTDDDETLAFKPHKGREFSLYLKEQFYETFFQNEEAAFYNLTALDVKKKLIDFHYQFKNGQLLKSKASKKGIYHNNSGFGKAMVYKNFNPNYPIIVS